MSYLKASLICSDDSFHRRGSDAQKDFFPYIACIAVCDVGDQWIWKRTGDKWSLAGACHQSYSTILYSLLAVYEDGGDTE